eukprot:c36693_g1_i1 orf=170-451(+)
MGAARVLTMQVCTARVQCVQVQAYSMRKCILCADRSACEWPVIYSYFHVVITTINKIHLYLPMLAMCRNNHQMQAGSEPSNLTCIMLQIYQRR